MRDDQLHNPAEVELQCFIGALQQIFHESWEAVLPYARRAWVVCEMDGQTWGEVENRVRERWPY